MGDATPPHRFVRRRRREAAASIPASGGSRPLGHQRATAWTRQLEFYSETPRACAFPIPSTSASAYRPRAAGKAQASRRLLLAQRYRPSFVRAVPAFDIRSDGRDARREIRRPRDDEPDHVAGREPARNRRRGQVSRGARFARDAHGPRHAGFELARLSAWPRGFRQRALLRHRTDRLGRREQARSDASNQVHGSAAAPAPIRVGRKSLAATAAGVDIGSGISDVPETEDDATTSAALLLGAPVQESCASARCACFLRTLRAAIPFYRDVLQDSPSPKRSCGTDIAACSSARTPNTIRSRSIPSLCAMSSACDPTPNSSPPASKSPTTSQLRDAVAYFREAGTTVRELPAELFPGIDYSADKPPTLTATPFGVLTTWSKSAGTANRAPRPNAAQSPPVPGPNPSKP